MAASMRVVDIQLVRLSAMESLNLDLPAREAQMREQHRNGDCKYFACPNGVILKLQMARYNPGRVEKVSCGCLCLGLAVARANRLEPAASKCSLLDRFLSALSERLTADCVPTLASTAAVGGSPSGRGSRVAQWLSGALTASCFWRRRHCGCYFLHPRRPHSTTVPSRSLVAASREKVMSHRALR